MVILHALAPAMVGGLERVVCALARGHQRLGHSVHVAAIATDRERGRLFLELAARNDVTPIMVAVGAREYLRERREFSGICRSVRPDIVHTHGYRPDIIDGPVARKLGIGTVTTLHGFTGGAWRNRLYEYLQAKAATRFDAVVAVSEPLAERLIASGVRRSRMHVLQNAWTETSDALSAEEARRRLDVPRSCYHIGWIGRLSHEKGSDVFVRALAGLKGAHDVKVSIIGDGDERERSRRLAHDLGLDDLILWHGIVPDAGSLCRAFDLYVNSSRTEGTPISVLEAVAARVPVIVPRVGGLPALLSGQQATFVAPDDPAALGEAIESVRRAPAAAAQRADAAARHLGEAFGLAPWLRRYEQIYESVCPIAHR